MKFTIPFDLEWPDVKAKIKFIVPSDKADLIAFLIRHLNENEELTEEDRKFYIQKVEEIRYSQ